MPVASLTESNAALAQRAGAEMYRCIRRAVLAPLRFSPSESGVPLDIEPDAGGPPTIPPARIHFTTQHPQ